MYEMPLQVSAIRWIAGFRQSVLARGMIRHPKSFAVNSLALIDSNHMCMS